MLDEQLLELCGKLDAITDLREQAALVMQDANTSLSRCRYLNGACSMTTSSFPLNTRCAVDYTDDLSGLDNLSRAEDADLDSLELASADHIKIVKSESTFEDDLSARKSIDIHDTTPITRLARKNFHSLVQIYVQMAHNQQQILHLTKKIENAAV